MKKMEGMISTSNLQKILARRDNEKMKKTITWILAIVGVITTIAAIAYAVYRFVTPDYLDDLDDEFEDDYEEDCFENEEV